MINTFDLSKAEQLHKQGQAPAHHLFGAIELKRDYNYNVLIPAHEKYSLLNRIGDLFDIQFLDQQLRAISIFREYDLIYAPFAAANTKLLILGKLLGIINKPLVILVHHPLFGTPHNRLKRWIARKLILKYDKVIFLSEQIRSEIINSYQIDVAHSADHFFSSNLGTDLNFYNKFISSSERTSPHSLISSGNSGRDFDILIAASKKLKVPIKIYCKPGSYPTSSSIPDHVEILSGEFPYDHICRDLVNASIVLIPLSAESEGMVGLTSLLEALALGKPVIMTKNNYINVDFEKENIGLTVNEGDIDGWVQAISSLLEDQLRLKEMGENSLRLAREKFNSNLFAQDLAGAIEDTYRHATTKGQ